MLRGRSRRGLVDPAAVPVEVSLCTTQTALDPMPCILRQRLATRASAAAAPPSPATARRTSRCGTSARRRPATACWSAPPPIAPVCRRPDRRSPAPRSGTPSADWPGCARRAGRNPARDGPSSGCPSPAAPSGTGRPRQVWCWCRGRGRSEIGHGGAPVGGKDALAGRVCQCAGAFHRRHVEPDRSGGVSSTLSTGMSICRPRN